MFLTAITFVTALCISAIAIYYSVAGLMTIFAAAAIPIMLMGGILEISKLVTAVWLHRYWNEAVWWLKTYLSIAVVVLMFITSMGIFGFLSKAHIEQTSNATSAQQTISRIDQEIALLEETIERSQTEIEKAETKTGNKSQEIQSQITLEQQRIDNALNRIQPEIDRQQQIIEREMMGGESAYQKQIQSIETNLENLRVAIDTNQIRTAQGIVGVKQDGAMGPQTRVSIDAYISQQEQTKQELLAEISIIRSKPNSIIENAETEITRIRNAVEEEIAESNRLINRLREQLGKDDSENVSQIVEEQQEKIRTAREDISAKREEKFNLQTELNLLEAEIGPVKYIAELIYGDAEKDVLEKSVRWVILIIIFVFDPLAVLLLIASQYSYNFHKKEDKLVFINSRISEDVMDFTNEKLFDTEEEPTTISKSKRKVRYGKRKT